MRTDDLNDACGFCSPSSTTAAIAHDPLVGRVVVGRAFADAAMSVRIGRTLAEGGIGGVYAGRAADGRAVAVKVLAARLARDPGVVSRFDREIQHALRIRHANVVSAIGAGRLDDGRPFLVMERLEGET